MPFSDRPELIETTIQSRWWRRLLAALKAQPADSMIRVARPPRSAEEARVAAILAGLPTQSRRALVDALADDLRSADRDPFSHAADLGFWRLTIYCRGAERQINALMGDFLVEK